MNTAEISPLESLSTPMLKQYHTIKSDHKDCVLLFRLGDFYEMFYEDARVIAAELDLVLTSRGKGSSHHVPMCGFPHHAAEGYIARLIKAGFKVAICEQMEDPALAKGIVKRDVTRVITAGTYLDENNSDTRFLLSLSPNGKRIGFAFCDASTGKILTNELNYDESKIIGLIARLPVSECVYPLESQAWVKKIFAHPLLKLKNVCLSPFDDYHFSTDVASRTLCDHFAIHNLSAFGINTLPQASASCAALIQYFREKAKTNIRHVDTISLFLEDDHTFISPAAIHGLELERLVKTIDYTTCALGKRMLRFWLYHPLKNIAAINKRQEAVNILLKDKTLRENLKSLLAQVPDLEKNISRISCGYTHPKDLLAIRNCLTLIPSFKKLADPLSRGNNYFSIEDLTDLRPLLERAVNEDMPISKPEGKAIRRGFNKELDQLRELQDNGRSFLADYQQREIKRSGINSLKIGFNKIFGYYIEITHTHSKNVPGDYIRKQTLVNAERFITPELKEYEEKILSAQEKISQIEVRLIADLSAQILSQTVLLHRYCETLANVDALLSLSFLAQSHGYVMPAVNESSILDIKEGRHPVVELTSTDKFIANDTFLDNDTQHLIILTGPNMAGKSTYIRQTAILTIMAQAGSFIPAKEATIGIVDKIFTRIGAHDDIARGQSTFMVEMNETADILNNLTARSLLILDEVGRGTSTFDGLSLAWALAEHLAQTRARTLFATHFHELTALADEHAGIRNYNVAVKEWKDEIIFLHKIVEGSSDDSYGIYVAKLAGIPNKIIERSRKILTQLECQNNLVGAPRRVAPTGEHQLNLFSNAPDPAGKAIKEALQSMDVNNMTPLEALNELQNIKNKINNL